MSAVPAATLSELQQRFLMEYLPQQRALSARTVESYGDALRLLRDFIAASESKPAQSIELGDFTPERIQAFLEYLERQRGNSVHSCNVRLAAVRCFLKFAAPWDASPRHAVALSLAVPMRRFRTASSAGRSALIPSSARINESPASAIARAMRLA